MRTPYDLGATEADPRTLVIGLGNPILSDDGLGPQVAGRVARALDGRPDVLVEEDTYGGIRLMERMVGFRRAIVVDVACTGAVAGTIFVLSPSDLPTLHSGSAHDASLPAALAVGRRAGAILPEDDAIRLVAVEAEDVWTFSERCTPAVERAIPEAVRRVLALVDEAPRWTEGAHAAAARRGAGPGGPFKGVPLPRSDR